jgi:pimeloyl-ACP methyl ester carboxylesterase
MVRYLFHFIGRILLGVAALSALAGCSQGISRGDEEAQGLLPPGRTPIVIVPGISREVGRELRGGTLAPLLAMALRTDEEALARLGDPRFPADGAKPLELPGKLDRALRESAVRGVQGLIAHLVQNEGYVRGDPDRPQDKDYPENPPEARADRTRAASLFVVYYDFRRDLAESACLLADRVARIRAATGAPKVLMVGNSLGGVVARYYLRYGGRDAMRDRACPLADRNGSSPINAPGAESVARLVTFGAPHRGSIQAFRALLQDVSLFGFIGLGLQEAVFTMPMTWQMLPFADGDRRVPLLVTADGEEAVPLYRPELWLERKWVPGSPWDPRLRRYLDAVLERSLLFQQRMDGQHPAEEQVARLLVGSDCRPTPVRALLADQKITFFSRFDTQHPLFAKASEPGDGLIDAASTLGLPPSPTVSHLRVCSSHSGYTDDSETVRRAVEFLLR